MNQRNETHLLSGAYALDAVSPAEAEAVEAAMRDSEELRGEVVGLADTAVTLGLAVPPAAPPARLRAEVLARARLLPQLPADAEPEPEPMAPTHLREHAHVAPRRTRRRRPAVLLALAAVAVLLFGGGVLVQRALVQPDLRYSAIVGAADAQSTVADVRGGGEAKVTWSASEGGSAIALTGVRAPAGHVLQVWTIHDGRAVSDGLYDAGSAHRLVDRAPAAGERLAVTVEPQGGSDRPTTQPIVAVPLST